MIYTIDRFTVKEGRDEEFRTLAADLGNLVERLEPRTAMWKVFFEESSRRGVAMQAHPDDQALLSYLGNETLAPLFERWVDCADTETVVLGNLGHEVREALAPWGVTLLQDTHGFARR